ncbi:MAG TPA: flagellar hook assembly protein FlgD [Burkholderiaceae bacterium]|nr:flagellar hook assembly protein FlgD [Burkholderiaceae bacterium]
MSTVQNNTISPSLLATMNPASDSGKASGTAATEDRFLKLLVAQMKNQDPLNPLDNAQVTSQMAQLSTVTGIEKLNATLAVMMSDQQGNQVLQAANLIGHGVLVPGASMALQDGKAIFGIELAEPADDVLVTVRDADGNPVQQINLGRQEAGSQPLLWDGQTRDGTQAADGIYTFEVAATRGGAASAASALSFSQVSSISTGAQGITLNLPLLGSVRIADVRQII